MRIISIAALICLAKPARRREREREREREMGKVDPEEAVESGELLSGRKRGRRVKSTRCYLLVFLAVALFVSAAVALAVGLGIGYGLADASSSNGESSSGTYRHAAVATDAAQCSEVGVDILREGGSAVDAAIASLLCVGVINFHSTGISGGGFMAFYNATSKTATALDYRETAPGRANSSMYAQFGPNETQSLYGTTQSCIKTLYVYSMLLNYCR